ncbi:MAG TPA: energy transducer TonB [bacterium]|mgnify:CR=1 FL=1|nr:energy transducer TonB [bacterium]HPO51391.1 energy transducer TonB [bacterium]HXK44679.1 energy transducer TonB [bacterium]
MKKALLASILIHVLFVILIVQNSTSKKQIIPVYVVDLMSLPPAIEISNNVISTFKPEHAEASIVSTSHRNLPIQTGTHAVKTGGERIVGSTSSVEKFSPNDFIAGINKKLSRGVSSPESEDTSSAGKSAPAQDSPAGKTSLASKIFPLTGTESETGSSIGIQTSSLPAGNIIPLEYLENIKLMLQRKWKPPKGKNYSSTSVVSFKIKKNGTVEEIMIEKSSGFKEFDESAIKAVKETTGIPPLPGTYKPEYLEIAVKFNVRGIE